MVITRPTVATPSAKLLQVEKMVREYVAEVEVYLRYLHFSAPSFAFYRWISASFGVCVCVCVCMYVSENAKDLERKWSYAGDFLFSYLKARKYSWKYTVLRKDGLFSWVT